MTKLARIQHKKGRTAHQCHWLWALAVVCVSSATTLAQNGQPLTMPAVDAPVVAHQRPLTLEECIQIGLANQPSVQAARASLAAAQAQQQALQKLRLASLLSRDIPIRKQQSCHGIQIAHGRLIAAEAQTIYAISRSYFTVLFAKKQLAVANDVVAKLKRYQKDAELALKSGNPDVNITSVDIQRIEVNMDLVRLKVITAQQGIERATAALREAMGLESCTPIALVEMELPGVQQIPCKADLYAMALAHRGEMVQVTNASQVVWLEVEAQKHIRSLQAKTFAAGTDIHADGIPQGENNENYRPGALGLEMPTLLVGHQHDRFKRAQDFAIRSNATVDKTRNLIGLELEDSYAKWQEAVGKLQLITPTFDKVKKTLNEVETRFQINPSTTEVLLRTRTLFEQVEAEYNEAQFQHALALAALSRITGGSFVPSYRQVGMPHVVPMSSPSSVVNE